jgi:hypothetical protein
MLATHPSDESSRIKAKVGHGSVCHTNLMGVNLHLTFLNLIAARVTKKSLSGEIVGAWVSPSQSWYSTDGCLTTGSWRKPRYL